MKLDALGRRLAGSDISVCFLNEKVKGTMHIKGAEAFFRPVGIKLFTICPEGFALVAGNASMGFHDESLPCFGLGLFQNLVSLLDGLRREHLGIIDDPGVGGEGSSAGAEPA